MNAAAQARAILVDEAARRLGLPATQLRTENGTVIAPDGRTLGYGGAYRRPAAARGGAILIAAAERSQFFQVYGKISSARQIFPARSLADKLLSRISVYQGWFMLGWCGRRATARAFLKSTAAALKRCLASSRLCGMGILLAVIAERVFQAIKAMESLSSAAKWEERPSLPKQAELPDVIAAAAAQHLTILDRSLSVTPSGKRIEATYTRAYQMHGSIGPSCAVAVSDDNGVTVWTHTQGVYPDRQAIAEMLQLPLERVRCIHLEGSGCYGHNAADDAAGDAALLSRTLPGRPIRVQWMRQQEHTWEPFGSAMVTKVAATIDGKSDDIVDWIYTVWSNTHSMRPGGAGALLAAQHMAEPFKPPVPKPIPQPEGGGDRNAIPLYKIPSARVIQNFLPIMPLRVSALYDHWHGRPI